MNQRARQNAGAANRLNALNHSIHCLGLIATNRLSSWPAPASVQTGSMWHRGKTHVPLSVHNGLSNMHSVVPSALVCKRLATAPMAPTMKIRMETQIMTVSYQTDGDLNHRMTKPVDASIKRVCGPAIGKSETKLDLNPSMNGLGFLTA